MRDIYTTSDVAARRGCDPATVRRVAARLGIGAKHGRDWSFSRADLDRLLIEIRESSGNPDFVRKSEKSQVP